MSRVVKISKPIIVRFEDREMNLPDELKNDIDKFWKEATKENPSLYNGPEYAVESIKDADEKTEVLIVKTKYAHYLYDERIGISEEKYRCIAPCAGILLLTSDNYFVIGQMGDKTSVPGCMQISGGGVDILDIQNGIFIPDKCIKRELKEELNLNLDDIKYKIAYIEYPNEKRNSYMFLAIGKTNKTKDELNEWFKEYNRYLIKNNLETEFEKLVFLYKEEADKQLDNLDNPKRAYLREFIKQAMKDDFLK